MFYAYRRGSYANFSLAVLLNLHVFVFLGLQAFYAYVYFFGTTQLCGWIRVSTYALSSVVLLYVIWWSGSALEEKLVVTI